MVAKKIIAPEVLAKAKYLYEETLTPIEEICAVMGASRSVFYRYMREEKWVRRRYSSGENAIEHDAVAQPPADLSVAIAALDGVREEEDAAQAFTPEERAALSARVFRAVQTQMATIEGVLKSFQPTQSEAQSERTVRIIAALNKSLREISAMLGPERMPPHDADDDPVPRDIDEFRRELARRIRSFIEARQSRAAGLYDNPAGALD